MRRGRMVYGCCGLMAALAMQTTAGPPATQPAPIAYGKAERIATLASPQITESSGLACSRLTDGVFWTHNDSGDRAMLYAFNERGEHLAACEVRGASARDWEDLCSFKLGRRSVLLIADVGDNSRRRNDCALYAVYEPALRPGRTDARIATTVAATIRFRYAEGPQNCEAVAFDPVSRTLCLVTKTALGPCRAYLFDWPKRPSDTPVVLKTAAVLGLPTVVAMDIAPDGRRAVLLSYGPAYEYTRGPDETWTQAFARTPRTLPLPTRGQGESICYGPDGRALYFGSEGRGSPLWRLAPAGAASRPAP